jgi:hypothetical protein
VNGQRVEDPCCKVLFLNFLAGIEQYHRSRDPVPYQDFKLSNTNNKFYRCVNLFGVRIYFVTRFFYVIADGRGMY